MTKDSVIHDKMNFYYKYREFSQTKDSIIKEKYLKDDEFVANAINYLDADELNSFFFFEHRSINPQLLDRIDIMKPLALKLFNSIQYSNLKHDLNAMIEIASQPGIHPMIICYVDPKIQNNIKFISRIIANTNAIDDFYDHSAASIGDSMMRYGDVIGEDVQTNPLFWEMLNAMMLKKNPKAKLFDTKKEIANAKEYFLIKRKKNLDDLLLIRMKLIFVLLYLKVIILVEIIHTMLHLITLLINKWNI